MGKKDKDQDKEKQPGYGKNVVKLFTWQDGGFSLQQFFFDLLEDAIEFGKNLKHTRHGKHYCKVHDHHGRVHHSHQHHHGEPDGHDHHLNDDDEDCYA
jgi:hypothetical protein